MKLNEIIRFLEQVAPPALQEGYDNSGLLVGHPDHEVKKALLCLDCTEAVIEEAMATGCDLIIAHHPIVFSGLKRFNGKTYVERVVMSAIRNQIALYAIHTNFDNVAHGVNQILAEKLGLQDVRILRPKTGQLRKVVVFVPETAAQQVASAMFAVGAGHIGNYSETSFRSSGTGTFRGNHQSNPAIGEAGRLEQVPEIRLETIVATHHIPQVIQAMIQTHPYEEPAYDIIPIENAHAQIGSGMVGNLAQPMTELDWLQHIKKVLHTGCIRHTALLGRPVKRIAICGGSGQFLLRDAISQQADFLITADFKYHEFFDAEQRLVIADVGHYESEQYTAMLLHQVLTEKFPTFALHLSEVNTNPVKYFI
ncbi:MAG: Nif3-like dinuclear metal center hexameric protein [Chitinophagales bacterium]